MATPTITSVTPAFGHAAGGTLVEVIGTGFRLPDAPPPTGPVPTPPPSMRAFFGTIEATRVDVISATRLLILTPSCPLPLGDGDVLLKPLELRNVGPYGETIGSERVVLADAYKFARPALDAMHETTMSRIVRELVQYLQRASIENVVIVQNTDWSDDPTNVLRKAAIAKLPAVFLAGPRLRKNTVHTVNDPIDVQVSTTLMRRYRAPRYVDLLFTIGAITDNYLVLLGLVEGITEIVERQPFVAIAKDEADAASELVRFEVQWEGGELEVDSMSNSINVFTASGTIVVLGVPVLGRPGFVRDMAMEEAPSFPDSGPGLTPQLNTEPE